MLDENLLQIITAIGSVATSVTAIILLTTLTNHKKQLTVSNFAEIIRYIGNDDARHHRRVIYKGYNDMKKLLEKYPEIEKEPKLDALNESAKYVAAVYDRVGFLLQQDKSLEDKMIEWHGFTTGVLWKLLLPLHEKWKEKDKAIGHKGFIFVGEKAYYEYKDKIDIYLRNREERYSRSDEVF